MDVKKEIAAADRRIQKQIDASARAALIRIGVDVEAMDREEAERQRQEAQLVADRRRAEAERQRQEVVKSFEAFGAMVREIHDHFVALGSAVSRGFRCGAS